ncbi:hypothetical protein EVA_16247 [gut metagenome]|uniref:Uncharacterized protein n=1 Tax=gut metagenome TaxID=749906 RepID=J9G1G4_9ZZZZ
MHLSLRLVMTLLLISCILFTLWIKMSLVTLHLLLVVYCMTKMCVLS